MNKGFTIIEALIAIFLVVVGFAAVFQLATQTVSSVSFVADKLIAAYLAQEGVEIVRNIRETNEIQGIIYSTIPWTDGLEECGYPEKCCELDYKTDTSQQGPANILKSIPCDDGRGGALTGEALYTVLHPFNLDANGLYSYSDGESTKFKRKINITKQLFTPKGGDIEDIFLDVMVEILWHDRTQKLHGLTLRGRLYDLP